MSKQTNNPKYMKFVEFAKTKQGRVDLHDPDLATLLGKTLYRVSNYVWNARKQQKLEVIAIRQGKTVIAYEFPAFKALSGVPAEPVQDVETVETVETVQEPETVSV